jgi:CSLREA domain-containing protein
VSRRQRRERQSRPRTATGPRPAHARLATGAGISLAAALGAPAAAQATDFTVTTLGDPATDGCAPTDCSLREAVEATEPNATDDRILFESSLTGTIALTGGQLLVTEPLEVLGPGAAALTVSGEGSTRIFYIDTDPADPVTISGLTLSDGDASSSVGGAIYSASAELTIRNSTISGSSAMFSGGGVFAFQGTTTIEGSTISGNDAGRGGGVSLLGGTTTIESSTIAGNEASNAGGGVYPYNSTTTIESATIAGNSATFSGGGIYSAHSPTDPTLANTIVAGNAAPSGPDLRGGGGDEFEPAFSLIGSVAGAIINETVAGSNVTGQDPQLGPLADNGGPTATRAPALGSPAVDAGSATGPDQRGLTRPVDLPGIANSTAAGENGADIGAVELQLPSNAFTLGALKRHRKKGTATLAVTVPGAGVLDLAGAKVKGATKNPEGAGIVKLLIRARGKARKRLRRIGKAKVRAAVTFTPTAGNPATHSRRVRLVRRKPR